MLVLRFIRFLLGYVCFTAENGFPERFINLCNLNKINIWNLKSSGSVITACTDRQSYRRIRPVAKKSGMKVRIKTKHGLPFFLSAHSRRAGVLLGIIFCCVCVLFLSTRIWRVEVTGNSRVPDEEIIAVFENLGLRNGASSKNLNASSIEAQALRYLPEISWLNVNFSGCTATVEVRETVIKPPAEKSDEPSNLVASRDGQIIILRPFNGTQEQKIGNPVLKGDLLISGIEQNKDLTSSFCKAEGYVVARTVREASSSQPLKIKALRITQMQKSYKLNFLFFDIPIGKSHTDFSDKSELEINGVTLPASLTRRYGYAFKECEITLERENAELLNALRYHKECAEEFRYLQIESGLPKLKGTPDSVYLGGQYTCIENIGLSVPMQISQEDNGQTNVNDDNNIKNESSS